MPQPRIWSLKEVVQEVNAHAQTILRWIERGKVRVKKKKNSSGHYVFTDADVRQLKAHRESVAIVE